TASRSSCRFPPAQEVPLSTTPTSEPKTATAMRRSSRPARRSRSPRSGSRKAAASAAQAEPRPYPNLTSPGSPPNLPAMQCHRRDIVGGWPPGGHSTKMGGQLLRVPKLADHVGDPAQRLPASAVQIEQAITETQQRVAWSQEDLPLGPCAAGLHPQGQ